MRNDLDGAEQSYLRARLELEPVGDRLLLARVTDGLGYIATTRGRMADALMLYEQAADMGAAAGLNETELGSRLNIAQAHHYLLHHALALEKLRALLPRIQAPSIIRRCTEFGSIAYANALIETGALSQAQSRTRAARRELRRPMWRRTRSSTCVWTKQRSTSRSAMRRRQCVSPTRCAASTMQAAHRIRVSRRCRCCSTPTSRVGDRKAAAALLGDSDASVPANVGARRRACMRTSRRRVGPRRMAMRPLRSITISRRSHSRVSSARRSYCAMPRSRMQQFQLGAGAVDLARATASVVGPYAEDDFAISLLMARIAAATHDEDLARSYFAQAHRLAGERWTKSLTDEEARLARAEQPRRSAIPAPRTVAGG